MLPTQSVSLRTSTLSFGRQREHLCLWHEHLDGELHASIVQMGPHGCLVLRPSARHSGSKAERVA